jgi:GTPase SAR1 family protein
MFEIRIAVLGYVSAGKTTVINALLRDKYGQVGMKRTTAGVNYFRLHPHIPTDNKDLPDGHGADAKATKAKVGLGSNTSADATIKNDSDSADASVWIADEDDDEECVPASETLREISKDNVTLRESSFVNVKTFDIAITEPICEVRPDTRLVLVDIPGINEAGADGKYRAYVREHWDTFDCALVVMDGRHGANTEEQVKLLEFVRDNNREKKDIRVIIVCNKVDDPEDQEQAELVKEANEEVAKIFAVEGWKPKGKKNKKYVSAWLRPIFVPTSAEFAYIYRTAALMSFEQFRKFDKDLIERLGRKEVGWKFSKLSPNEKFRLAYQAVTERELFDDRIQATNFDVVLKAIKDSIGGSATQLRLIQKQIDVALRALSHKSSFVEKLRGVFHKRRALGQPTEDLPSHFWETYQQCEDAAFRSFAESPTGVKNLEKPVKELVEFCAFAKNQGLDDECAKCMSRFKALVVRQIGLFLSKESIANAEWVTREATDSVQWGSLHPIDWVRACQSVLLVSNSKAFYDQLGREIMLIDDAKHKWMDHARQVPSSFGNCQQCPRSSLDFNGYCRTCKVFVFPIACSFFAGLSADLQFPVSTNCQYCLTRKVGSNGYCSYCSRSTPVTVSKVWFVESNVAENRSFALFCPYEFCSKKLTKNRVCDACKAIYCLKDSPRIRTCLICSNQLMDGKCTASSCGGGKLMWKELPYSTLLETLRCEYDPTDGAIKPKYPKTYRSAVRLVVPSNLSDPKYFGHVAWKYCQFVESHNSAF